MLMTIRDMLPATAYICRRPIGKYLDAHKYVWTYKVRVHITSHRIVPASELKISHVENGYIKLNGYSVAGTQEEVEAAKVRLLAAVSSLSKPINKRMLKPSNAVEIEKGCGISKDELLDELARSNLDQFEFVGLQDAGCPIVLTKPITNGIIKFGRFYIHHAATRIESENPWKVKPGEGAFRGYITSMPHPHFWKNSSGGLSLWCFGGMDGVMRQCSRGGDGSNIAENLVKLVTTLQTPFRDSGAHLWHPYGNAASGSWGLCRYQVGNERAELCGGPCPSKDRCPHFAEYIKNKKNQV